jgi:hypothetical protein
MQSRLLKLSIGVLYELLNADLCNKISGLKEDWVGLKNAIGYMREGDKLFQLFLRYCF